MSLRYSIDFTGAEPRETVTPELAVRRILSGGASANMRVAGHLNLSGNRKLKELPEGLCVEVLDASNCPHLTELPRGLQAHRINVNGCTSLRHLPAGLTCYELGARNTALRSLPADLKVELRLDLQDCHELTSLPEGLKVGALSLRNCRSLRRLPEGLSTYFLDLSGCTALTGWPSAGSLRVGRLVANGATWLRELPTWITELAQLDVTNCENLTDLPEGLRVSSFVDLAGSGLRALPASMEHTQIRWRGVPVEPRVAFQPESICADEIFREENVERRRVLIERMGYERFIEHARAEVLDRDVDPGGQRQLLRVSIPDDEPLVCVSLLCPSTTRQYLIRVPPTTRTCHQAAAWIAGYDNPDDYRPIAET